MKAAVIESPGAITVREVPDLAIDDYGALVKTKACAICNGTDTKLLHGKFGAGNQFPGILGHESVGEVVEVGKRVRRYKTGDHVIRAGAIYFGDQAQTLQSCWGGFAEYGMAFDTQAMAEDGADAQSHWSSAKQQIVPPDMDPGEATMIITLKETLNWLERFGVGPDSSLLIQGSGPVGLAYTRWAKVLGAHPVLVTGRRDERLERFTEAGADAVINVKKEDLGARVQECTGGKGVDRVVEAVGLRRLIPESVPLLAPGGSIGVYGIPESDAADLELPAAVTGGKPWKLEFFGASEEEAHEQVLDAVRLGFVSPASFLTHRLPLEAIAEGFELLAKKEAFKVVIEM